LIHWHLVDDDMPPRLLLVLLTLGLVSCHLLLPFRPAPDSGDGAGDARLDGRGDGQHGDRPPASDRTSDLPPTPMVVTVAGAYTTCNELCGPHGLFLAANGDLFVANEFSYRVGVLRAPLLPPPTGTRQPDRYASDGESGKYVEGPLPDARFGSLLAIAGLGADLVVADAGYHRIRLLQPTGTKSIGGDGTDGCVDGKLGTPSGLAVVAGIIYVADASCNTIRAVSGDQVTTFAGNGKPTSVNGALLEASFWGPHSLAYDPGGQRLYVTDCEGHRVRRIGLANAVVSDVAGDGNPGYADNADALKAQLDCPAGIATDGTRIYVADYGNDRIRVIDAGGMKTLAGSGQKGHIDGPALAARFHDPDGLALDAASGVLYVADYNGEVIRAITGLPH
jgi:DNA-binding beta-propeller fold protein YncE